VPQRKSPRQRAAKRTIIRREFAECVRSTMTKSLYLPLDPVPSGMDSLWARLKDKAQVGYPPEDFNYDIREFAIRDNNGYLMQFSREIGGLMAFE
jgi:hypothetical protein